MPLIREVEDALRLVADLPKDQQEVAAFFLRSVAMNYEEEMTMTEGEQEALENLRDQEDKKKYAAFQKRIRKYL